MVSGKNAEQASPARASNGRRDYKIIPPSPLLLRPFAAADNFIPTVYPI
jgi:hypothetical protein